VETFLGCSILGLGTLQCVSVELILQKYAVPKTETIILKLHIHPVLGAVTQIYRVFQEE
jgi:hypothetical protein